MPILELRDVQHPVVRWAKEHGMLVIRFTPYGDIGWPDCIFINPATGRLIWIEFKAPGKLLKPIQEERHNQLRSAKQYVYRVDSKQLGIAILQAELDSTRIPEESYEDALRVADGRFVPRPRTRED